MKQLTLLIALLALSWYSMAQKSFTGVVKYKLTVEGTSKPRTDSMTVIFDKSRVKVIMYIPDLKNYWFVEERVFIDDFNSHKTYTFSAETETYQEDSLKMGPVYEFINSNKYGAAGPFLGFTFKAKLNPTPESIIKKAECLASIDFYVPSLNQYSFLGYQPIIVDNRLVLDYTITQTNGTRPRVYVSEILPMDNVDSYFNIEGFTKAK